MKRSFFFKHYLTAGVIATVLAMPAFAQADRENQQRRPDQQLRPAVTATTVTTEVLQLGPVVKAHDIIGGDVMGSDGEKIANISDLAVDIESGRVVLAILGYGGVAGLGADYTAVPATALSAGSDPANFHLTATATELKAAPKFDLANWTAATDPAQVAAVYQSYGHDKGALRERAGVEGRLPVRGEDRANQNVRSVTGAVGTRAEAAGQLERGSKVLGAKIKNSAENDLGSLDELLVDLRNGRIVDAVVSTGGFLGIGDDKTVVPPMIFRWDQAANVLYTEATKEQLSQAPRLAKDGAWPDHDSSYVTKVYRAFGMNPYFGSDSSVNTREPDNTAVNRRDRDATSVTPLDQGNNANDLNVTAQIRREIMDNDNLGVDAKNIKVITSNGRVTLRGVVASQAEKDQIGQIAAKSAGNNAVDNQLEVKSQ